MPSMAPLAGGTGNGNSNGNGGGWFGPPDDSDATGKRKGIPDSRLNNKHHHVNRGASLAREVNVQYNRLADAVVRVEQKVNFYGIVAEYEQPKPTRGQDMSYNSPGLRVLYFAPELDMMPRVEVLGDIIGFHLIQMRSHVDALQAIGNPKIGLLFVVLRGSEGNDYKPYRNPRGNLTMEGLINMKQIKDFNVDFYFDLCCKILFVNNQSAESSVIMYDWDGTDASPNPLEQGENGDSGQEIWSSKELAVLVDVMRGFPALGIVLPLVPSGVAEDDFAPQLPLAEHMKSASLQKHFVFLTGVQNLLNLC